MYSALKNSLKRTLITLACRHLGLQTEKPAAVSDLGHPLTLIERQGLVCRGIIHVGANTGQEFDDYRQAGLECVIYVEPLPEIFEILRRRISGDSRHIAVNALCSDRGGETVNFKIASNGAASSSMFAFGSHARHHPEVTYTSTIQLQTSTLDSVIFETPTIDPEKLDTLVVDVQGAEMKVISGAQRTLAHCKCVFIEVNEGGLYEGDFPYTEIIAALAPYGFALKSFDLNRHGWGNAFFVKSG